MGRLLVIPIALVAMLAGAMVWSGGGALQQADFRFINRGDINTLDPNQMSYLQDIRIGYAMWEGLYGLDAMTLDPVPGVATGFEKSADGRVYTFHLRSDARWSNGDPVVAGDFAFAWKRMLDEPGDYTYLHYYIRGAEDYVTARSKGATADFGHVGVEVLDAHTMRITLNDPVTFFLDLIAFPVFFPLHAKSMEPFREVDARTGNSTYRQQFTRPPHVVGNGPFVLAAWDFKRRLFLEKNPHYWDRGNVKSESIEMVVVEDPLSQFMMYESGTIQWLSDLPKDIAPELIANHRPDLHNFAGFGTAFVTMMVRAELTDGSRNPLADKRLRQALALALDREQIVRNITRCGETPATTFVPPDVFASQGWRSTPGIQFNPAAARKLLADAGYAQGGRIPGLRFVFRSGAPLAKDIAENLASQWKRNLNLEVPLEQVELKIFSQRLKQKDYVMGASNWIGDYNDVSTFTDKYLSTSANNDAGWVSAQYDRLIRDATKEADAARRLRMLEQAERILDEEAPIVPLYHLTNQYMFRDNVKGINLNPRNMTMFKAAEVTR